MLRMTTVWAGLLFTFPFPLLKAEEQAPPPISVKAEVDQAFLTIGDPVAYTVTIKHSPNVQILSEIPPPASDILQIKKIEDIRRREDGLAVEGKKFTLTSYRLGEFVLDPVKVNYRIEGGDPQAIETNKVYLTVKSVAEGEEKKDIRGIKSVLQISPSRLFLILILLLLVLGVLGLLIYRSVTRPKGEGAASKPVLSPEDQALAALSELYDSDLLRRGKVKEYHLRLSEILRAYFETRFAVMAIESTTYEIGRALREKDVDSTLREKIMQVLEAADLAKFAKWIPDPVTIKEMFQKSKQIIEEAKPKAAEESSHGV